MAEKLEERAERLSKEVSALREQAEKCRSAARAAR
jgi:chaperonin cofactor prefoldin